MNIPDPPWGRRQSEGEAVRIHERWLRKLTVRLPQGVPESERAPGWPATFGQIERYRPVHDAGDDGDCLQCGGCRYYVAVQGDIGLDWGACTNAVSEYDGRVVFELWTCSRFQLGS